MSGHFEYELHVDVRIDKVYVDDEQPAYRSYSNDRLSVNETVSLGTLNFLQIAKVLGSFHDLAEQIKADQKSIEE